MPAAFIAFARESIARVGDGLIICARRESMCISFPDLFWDYCKTFTIIMKSLALNFSDILKLMKISLDKISAIRDYN
jgi:hypothetical protein